MKIRRLVAASAAVTMAALMAGTAAYAHGGGDDHGGPGIVPPPICVPKAMDKDMPDMPGMPGMKMDKDHKPPVCEDKDHDKTPPTRTLPTKKPSTTAKKETPQVKPEAVKVTPKYTG